MLPRNLVQLFRNLSWRQRCPSRPIRLTFPTSKGLASIFRHIILILAVLLIPLAPFGFAKTSTQDNPHHFLQYCGNCHQPAPKTDNAQDKIAGPLHLDINQACTQAGCHDYSSPLNHPVGIVAGGHIPPEMPLNAKSQITCLTCHDELNRSNQYPAYLRHASGPGLCASCHQTVGNNLRTRSHWQFTTKAHLDIPDRQVSSEDYPEIIGGIDRESYTCLSCHDNISAIVAGDNESASERRRRWKKMSDHPIGMAYATRAQRSSRDFNMPDAIDARVRLFNGRVGCGSCHNLYNRDKSNLALPSARGALCRQCHIR